MYLKYARSSKFLEFHWGMQSKMPCRSEVKIPDIAPMLHGRSKRWRLWLWSIKKIHQHRQHWWGLRPVPGRPAQEMPKKDKTAKRLWMWTLHHLRLGWQHWHADHFSMSIYFNMMILYKTHMEDQFDFQCRYCGRDFGGDVIKLARHIGRRHDPGRQVSDWVDSIMPQWWQNSD